MRQDSHIVLLHGDVDAIKEFVFETSALPQIRGASQLLIECEDKVKKVLERIGGEEIYCAGGSFLFKIPTDRAEEAGEQVKRLYLDHTLAATVTVISEPSLSTIMQQVEEPMSSWSRRLWKAYQPSAQSSGFAQQVAFLGAQMREAKGQKEFAPFWEAFPFGKRCDACGKRIASTQRQRREPDAPEIVEDLALCPVCLHRHNKGREKAGHKARGKFNHEFLDYLKNRKGIEPHATQPSDLDHLVKSARRHQYLAFLYADGNDIGKFLQTVQSEEEFKSLSFALMEGSKKALFEALFTVCSSSLNQVEDWPFEIVNIGGDDVTLLIQAGYAWEVGVEFLKRFEENVRHLAEERLGSWPTNWPPITAACGIAIADPKYPIRYLERLSADLLKKAKQRAKVDRNNVQSAITFLWLSTPVASESADPLLAYYEPSGTQMALTARPYTLEQAKEVMKLAQSASSLPRALRHRWGEALEKGLWVSLNTVYYDIARRKEEEQIKMQALINAVGQLITVNEQPAPAPLWKWNSDREKWHTALLDILELAELRATRPDVKEEEEM
jgi:CRISPR/Cas system-associated protein Cas10 (large subunit of type III CRISPR-Cas system)